MNLNEMQNVWNSPRNNLPAEEQQHLAQRFTRQMIRRRRFQAIWLTSTFIWLTIITAVVLRIISLDKIKPGQEWALFPLLIVLWAFAIHFLRRFLRPAAAKARGEIPIMDSLRAALVSNREARLHLKLVGVLYGIMIPLLVLAMHQLQTVGKASDRELISMAVFFGAVLLVCGVTILIRYFRCLQPQGHQLDVLLKQLADEG